MDERTINKCKSNILDDIGPSVRFQLENLRRDNLNKIISAHIKINSMRNKLEQLTDLIKGEIDILTVSESKINHSFPDSQFFSDGIGMEEVNALCAQ